MYTNEKISISSNESFTFGEISYDEAGDYEYTVSREIIEASNLKQDDSVYKCIVKVTDDLATVVFEKIAASGKLNRIQYIDTFVGQPETPDTEDSPKTPGEGKRTYFAPDSYTSPSREKESR